MNHLEILIDRLLVYVPMDVPFVSALLQRGEGRYIIFGIAVVGALLLVWLLLALAQMLFSGDAPKTSADKTPPIELAEAAASGPLEDGDKQDGFSFFKKSKDTTSETNDEDAGLVAIEQEMLAVRRLYTDGHLIKDVYVSETRRLYGKAQALKNG